MNKEEGEREWREEPKASKQQGKSVLTVSQAISPIAIQAEVSKHSGQLTATVDLGLVGVEKTAEQKGKDQQCHHR